MTTLLIRNITPETKKHNLERLFQGFGKIFSIIIPQSNKSFLGKGYGYVLLEDDKKALEALEKLDKKNFYGKYLRIFQIKHNR